MDVKRTFDFKELMNKAGAPTAQVMAEMCGLNRKGVHNRINRGIGWIEADELAVRCGFLPWEVWPQWADIDPANGCRRCAAPTATSSSSDLDDLTQDCSACRSMTIAA